MSYEDQELIADLRALLARCKRSARSVSQAIGVPYRSMQNYLSGESRMPALVLVKVLDELGADLRRLRHGDNLLRHGDLYDAVHEVFGEFLERVPLDRIGTKPAPIDPRSQTPEMMEAHLARAAAATELAVRLSEAYDRFVGQQLGPGHMPTIRELREMSERRKALREPDEKEVGQ